jgi:hypothetical protein
LTHSAVREVSHRSRATYKSEAAFRRATAREIATALARRFDVDLPRFPRQRFDTD